MILSYSGSDFETKWVRHETTATTRKLLLVWHKWSLEIVGAVNWYLRDCSVQQGCGGWSYWIVVTHWKWEGRASNGPRWPFGTLVLQRVCTSMVCDVPPYRFGPSLGKVLHETPFSPPVAWFLGDYYHKGTLNVCLPHQVWPQPSTHLCAFSMCHASFVSAPLPQRLLSGEKNSVAKEVKSHVCGIVDDIKPPVWILTSLWEA